MKGRLLVIAPHPDDELIGAGGIMVRHQQQGGLLAVIVVTDGSASDPNEPRARLAARRRRECEHGLLTLLGECPPLLFLDQPDGMFDASRIDLSPDSLMGRFLAAWPPATVIVSDPADAHPDHKAAFGLATRLIGAGYGDVLQVVPISQRVDGDFDPRGYVAAPVGWHGETKAAALACHASQLDTATGFTLAPTVLREVNQTEYTRLAFDRGDRSQDAVQAAHFDSMFAESSDPWGYDDTPYERDRFRRTLAALSDRQYDYGLELGCANGALTEHLAPLCKALVATDISQAALRHAETRLAAAGNVRFEQRRLPNQLPGGTFDLIVVSDMLYYLGLEGVIALMCGLKARAAPDCRMLIASYLGETDTRLTGEMASEAALAQLRGWKRIHTDRCDRLRIDALERG